MAVLFKWIVKTKKNREKPHFKKADDRIYLVKMMSYYLIRWMVTDEKEHLKLTGH